MGTLTVTTKAVFAPTGAEQVGVDTGQEINNITTTGNEVQEGIQEIGTSEEQITVSADIAQPGVVWIKNLDSTNFVEVGGATGVYFVRLNPGEVNILRMTGTALFLLADTAACRVQYKIFED